MNESRLLKFSKAVLVGTAGAVLMIAGFTGCDGSLVNGAHTIPTVKYRPDAANVAKTEAVAETSDAGNSAIAVGGVGTLKGRVVFEGQVPTLPPSVPDKDTSVCGVAPIPNESIVVNDGGLANVFVYLEKAPKGAKISPPEGDAIFDQKACIFIPHAMVVRTKQTMLILNDDAAAHNTHTRPKKSSEFNSVVSPKDRKGVPLKYDQVEREPFAVGCDIHSWMTAYQIALDHPFASVSAANGTFEIKDLPAGKHEFKVWHEAGKFVEKALVVDIKPGENEITIKVPVSKLVK